MKLLTPPWLQTSIFSKEPTINESSKDHGALFSSVQYKQFAVSMNPSSDASSDSGWTSSDMEDTQEKLCETCREIDFSPAFPEPKPSVRKIPHRSSSSQGTFISNVRHFLATCELCEQFELSTMNLPGENIIFDVYDLRAFSVPTSVRDKVSMSVSSPKEARWLQLMPYGGVSDDPAALDDIAVNATMNGWTACSLTTNVPGMFRPQSISKDFSVCSVKTWLSACKDCHGHMCNTSAFVSNLLLIDCNTLQVCHVSPQPQFVALSYVWGKAVSSDEQMPRCSIIEGKLHLPPEDSLSQVVKDSISVTKQLGFRYIWIDKYCINQHDAAVQMKQIENMDLVYMSAELTIIAASGNDERHGLSGVGIERHPRRVVE